MTYFCITGCGRMAVHEHHVIYAQELRRVARTAGKPWSTLVKDRRNLVPVCLECHAAHHARTRPLEFWTLPNSVFAFTRDVLGAGPGYEWLIRRYVGEDERVASLLAEWVAAA